MAFWFLGFYDRARSSATLARNLFFVEQFSGPGFHLFLKSFLVKGGPAVRKPKVRSKNLVDFVDSRLKGFFSRVKIFI